jgi:hypothetical protein
MFVKKPSVVVKAIKRSSCGDKYPPPFPHISPSKETRPTT